MGLLGVVGAIWTGFLLVVAVVCLYEGWTSVGTWALTSLFAGALVGAFVAHVTDEVESVPLLAAMAGTIGTVAGLLFRIALWLN